MTAAVQQVLGPTLGLAPIDDATLAKRLEQFTGGEVQKSTNTAPGRGCRCNSDLRPHYVATIAAGLASHPSYWVAGDLITSRIAEDAFDLADALMSTNRGKQP